MSLHRVVIRPLLILFSISSLALLTGCATYWDPFDDNYNESNFPQQIRDNRAAAKPIPPAKPRYSFPASRVATGSKEFIFDPSKLAWAAYDANGQLLKQGRASGGKDYCPDTKSACRTPVGSYRVGRKGDASCVSKKYPLGEGGAPMPHCMFFHGGYAIHGSYNVPDYNASHGCIRVTPAAARWLSNNFIKHGTKVRVKSYY